MVGFTDGSLSQALNLTGSRLASAVNEAPATLGLVLQTLRHLAASHMGEIAHFADVLPTWCMHEVSLYACLTVCFHE